MPTHPVAVLLPPSEAKRTGGAGRWTPASGIYERLGPARRSVAAALAAAMLDPPAAARVVTLKGDAGLAARQANLATVGAPVLPACHRYTGVVWQHLDPGSLRGRARQRAGSLTVVSALGGLWGWDDPVPDYKCKLGVRLDGIGSLAAYWRPLVTAALAERVGGGTVWDLLPGEHRRAVDLGALGGTRVLHVDFVTATGRAAGHDAKAAKGAFARHLVETGAGWGRARPGPAVDAFTWGGWTAELTATSVTVRRP